METINYQNVNVNVLDADTKEVIPFDFLAYFYPIDNGQYRTIRGGCDTLASMPVIADFVEIHFNADQLSSIGYDYSSITGNLIYFTQMAEIGGTPLNGMPRVVNIYVKKLKA